MVVLVWIWFGLTGVALCVWLSRHLQIARVGRLMPALRSDSYRSDSPPNPAPSISVLVAAKDEEANIARCLRSLLAQDYPQYEVIAIDDRSTDRTPLIIDELAEGCSAPGDSRTGANGRLTALHVKELAEGWFGKNNAMREGAARAKGQWLCFTDADCEFTSPRVLAVAMRFASEHQADFVSVLPAHRADSFWERVLQPACSGILLIWFHPLRVNDPSCRTAYANGAFMLMRRSCYETIGGHEPVKAEVNEDIHMARLAKERGQRLAVVTNDDLYTVRMYESLAQGWRGWTRIFYGCFGSVRRLLLSALVVTVMSLLPWIALATSAAVMAAGGGAADTAWRGLCAAAAATCVAQLSVTVRFYGMSRSGTWYGLLYPVGAAIGFAALLNAVRRVGGRGKITWRGTTYQGSQVTGTR
jgi:cellulose synthase/poly-beta-1,6-N-acetylglucosamine synthase-like glycosyltransferase